MKMRRPINRIFNFVMDAELLREVGLKPRPQVPETLFEKETEGQESEKNLYIRCKQCQQIITTASDRIVVQGSHRHTFANPYGTVFDIGCFSSARGFAYMGPFSAEFTWFRGFRWKAAVCALCLTHLGWFFLSSDGGGFYGLILERLVES